MCGSRSTFAARGAQTVRWFAGLASVKPSDVKWVTGAEFKRAFPDQARGFAYDFMKLIPVADGREYAIGAVGSSVRPITRRVIFTETDRPTKCGAMCRNAKGPMCDCSCKGENHGAGVSMSRKTIAKRLDRSALAEIERIGEDYGQRAFRRGVKGYREDSQAQAAFRMWSQKNAPVKTDPSGIPDNSQSVKAFVAFTNGWNRGWVDAHEWIVKNPPRFGVGDLVGWHNGARVVRGSVLRVNPYAKPEPEYVVELHDSARGAIKQNLAQSSLQRMARARFAEGFKGFVDPWAAMNPEDRREAGRLSIAALKAMPSSPRQNEIRAKLNAILAKYGLDKPPGQRNKGTNMKHGKKAAMARELIKSKGNKRVYLGGPDGNGKFNLYFVQVANTGVPGESPAEDLIEMKQFATEAKARSAAQKMLSARLGAKAAFGSDPNIRLGLNAIAHQIHDQPELAKKNLRKLAEYFGWHAPTDSEWKEFVALAHKLGFSDSAIAGFSRPGAKAAFAMSNDYMLSRARYELNELAKVNALQSLSAQQEKEYRALAKSALTVPNRDASHVLASEVIEFLDQLATRRARETKEKAAIDKVRALDEKIRKAHANKSQAGAAEAIKALLEQRNLLQQNIYKEFRILVRDWSPASLHSRLGSKAAFASANDLKGFGMVLLQADGLIRHNEIERAKGMLRQAEAIVRRNQGDPDLEKHGLLQTYEELRGKVGMSRLGAKSAFSQSAAWIAKYLPALNQWWRDRTDHPTDLDASSERWEIEGVLEDVAEHCREAVPREAKPSWYAAALRDVKKIPHSRKGSMKSYFAVKKSVAGTLVTLVSKAKGEGWKSYYAEWPSAKDARVTIHGVLVERDDGRVTLTHTSGQVVSEGTAGFGSMSAIRMSRAGAKSMHAKPTLDEVMKVVEDLRRKGLDDVAKTLLESWLRETNGGRNLNARAGAKARFGRAERVLSDGSVHLDFAEAKQWLATASEAELNYIRRDARQAADAMPDGKKWNYYHDLAIAASEMLQKRRMSRAGAKSKLNCATPAEAEALVRQYLSQGRAAELYEIVREAGYRDPVLERARANAKISEAILALKAKGVPTAQAIDQVLGAGTTKRMADKVYDAFNASRAGAKANFAHPSWSAGLLGKETAPQLAAYSWIDNHLGINGRRTQMLLADIAAEVHARNPSLSIQQAILKAAQEMVQKGVATYDIRALVEDKGWMSRTGAKATHATDPDAPSAEMIREFVEELRRFATNPHDWYTAANTWLSRKRAQQNRTIAIAANRAYDIVEKEIRRSSKSTHAADDKVSRKIATLVREGYPQDQAAAIAYDMKRRGEL